MSNGFWTKKSTLRGIAALAYLAYGAGSGSIGPILPWLAGRWSVALDQTGALFSMLFLGCCATTILSGALLDQVGRKPLLVVLLALMGGGVLAVPFAPDLLAGLLATFVMGLGAGSTVALNVLVGDLAPSNRGPALSLMGAAFGFGSLTAPLLVGLMTQLLGTPAPAPLIAGALLLLGSLGFARCVFPTGEPPPVPTRAEPRPGRLAVLRDRYVLVTALLLFLYVGIETAFGGWIFSFAQQGAHIAAATAGLTGTVFWFLFTLGRVSAGILGRRVAGQWLTLAGCAAAALGAGLIAVLPSSALIIFLAAALVGIGFGPVFPIVFGLLTARYTTRVGAASSLVTLGGSLGGALLPYLSGYLLVVGGVSSAAAAIGVAIVLVALLLLVLAYAFPATQGSPSA